MKRLLSAVAVAVVMAAPAAHAEFKFKQENLYVGGGLGYTMFDGAGIKNAMGYQFFGGYDLEMKLGDKVDTALEVGYQSSGDLEFENCAGFLGFACKGDAATGLWINGVFTYPVDDKIGVLGRIGLDIGDDDGLMFGAGAGYKLAPQFTLRGEFVIHPNYKSLEANVVYDF